MNGLLQIYTIHDQLCFELDFIKPAAYQSKLDGGDHALPRFFLYSALDMVDIVKWSTTNTYLRTIDQYGPSWYAIGYVSISGDRLLLLHDTSPAHSKRDEEAQHASWRAFMRDVQTAWRELFVVNPYYQRERVGEWGGPAGLAQLFPQAMNQLEIRVRKALKEHGLV